VRALGYWRLSANFLGLVEAAGGELVKADNAWVVVGDTSLIDHYEEMTRWSDHRIGVPLLFNLFHGVELMLKGFLSLKRPVPGHHRLSQLHAQFESDFPGTTLGSVVLASVVDPDPTSPLGRFFATNCIDVDKWYEALKYPESRSGGQFDHAELRYGAGETLAFWDGVRRSAIEMRVAAVELAEELGEIPSTEPRQQLGS